MKITNKIFQKSYVGRSYIDIMRDYRPEITEEEADFILWEKTCFPFNSKTTIEQIIELLTQSKRLNYP